MQRIDTELVYSATDIVGALECRHLAHLERAAVDGHLRRPMRADPVLDRIAQRGVEYERRFLEELPGNGLTVVEIPRCQDAPRAERLARGREATIEAMHDGGRRHPSGRALRGTWSRLRGLSEAGGAAERTWSVGIRGLGHEARAARDGFGSAPTLHVLGDPRGVAGASARGNAPRARRSHAPGGLVPRSGLCRLLPARWSAISKHSSTLPARCCFPLPTKAEPVEHCEVCRWSTECRAQVAGG